MWLGNEPSNWGTCLLPPRRVLGNIPLRMPRVPEYHPSGIPPLRVLGNILLRMPRVSELPSISSFHIQVPNPGRTIQRSKPSKPEKYAIYDIRSDP
ncbi:unnamed protein product [Prunus brigantina]